MNWDLTGQRIKGYYLDKIPFIGKVVSSRVMLGARVSHTVKLDEPIPVFGELRDEILVRYEKDSYAELA